MPQVSRPIVYLGFNDPRKHVRGTENVIKFQGAATTGRTFFVFRGERAEAFRWGRFVAIAVPRNYFTAFFCLRRLIAGVTRRSGPPIVHGHSYLLSAMVTGAPLVFTVHDALAYSKRLSGSVSLVAFKAIECWVYYRAKLIHSVSRFTWSEATAQRFYLPKIRVIFNTTTDSGSDCLHRPSAEPLPTPYLLVVRSIEPRANMDLVLELAGRMLSLQPNVRIEVAGKGPLLARYQKCAAERGLSNLRFLGYVSDEKLNELYWGAECVVLPALYGEGFGLPLIEAYARGIPAIGSNVCAVPEVIAGRELLFENNVDSLLAALSAARSMSKEIFVEHYRRRFGESLVIDQYRDLYASLERNEFS